MSKFDILQDIAYEVPELRYDKCNIYQIFKTLNQTLSQYINDCSRVKLKNGGSFRLH